MLRYCFDVQLSHLADGMTEFSADETYIAGNVFPRYCMYHGSAESTSVMLEILDSTGAWVEYYDNKKPYNCRCRPWESAINIEAIIEYVKHL